MIAEVVVGMDKHQRLRRRQFMGVRRRLRQGFADQNDIRAPRRGAGDLRRRRELRHHDRGGYTQQTGVTRDRLGMIARRHGDHAARSLVPGQHRQAIGRATLLEGAGDLQVVQLQQHVRAGNAGYRLAGQHRGAQDAPGNTLGRLLNVLERDHRFRCLRSAEPDFQNFV